MARTAYSLGIRTLYHWEPFVPAYLSGLLKTNLLHCSSPSAFNDPWDCKPFFNTGSLDDPEMHRRHVDWAVNIATRGRTWLAADIDNMRSTLMTDKKRTAELLVQMSEELWREIAKRYRVYCLGPNPTDVLMWSHYAKDHTGICLEFSLTNDVMCCALECQYEKAFPMLSPDGGGDHDEALTVLLAKSDVWRYEQEFRIVAQERVHAHDTETLLTDNSFLQLPKGALIGVIVGCQADVEAVRRVVDAHAPGLPVKRAVRVPNRYEVLIQP